MAGLKKTEISKFLTDCFLCRHKFDDPRILECFHTFCCYCLVNYVRETGDDYVFNCPLCDYENPVPENGPTGFPRSYYIELKPKFNPVCDICGELAATDKFCTECDQILCQYCLKSHAKRPATQEHQIAQISRKEPTKTRKRTMCPIHKKEEIKHFCEDCKEMFCSDCNMSFHKKHKLKDIRTTAETYRSSLTSVLRNREYESFITQLYEERDILRKEKNIDKDDYEDMLMAIEDRTKMLHERIDDIRYEMVSKLVHSEEKNSKEFSSHIEMFDKKMHSFGALFYFGRRLVHQADDAEITTSALKLENRLALLNAEDIPKYVKIERCGFEKGVLDTDALAKMFGKITITNKNNTSTKLSASFPCRQNYVISGIAPISGELAWVSLGTEGLLGLYDSKGNCKDSVSLDQQVDDITVSRKGTIFVSTNTGKKIIEVKNGNISLFYRSKLCTRGIQFDSVTDKLFVTLTAEDTFSYSNIRVDNKSKDMPRKDPKTDRVFVTLATKDTFSSSNNDKSKVVAVTLPGPRKNKLFVALTAKDKVSNANIRNDDVDKSEVIAITEKGDLFPDIILEKPIYPTRIAVMANGGIVISDWKECTLNFFNQRGNRIAKYKGRDYSEMDKFCPRGVCCDNNDNVYVIDHNKDCIHQLDMEGNFKRVLSLDSRVSQIWSVACDISDKLWIGTQTGRVHIVQP